MKRLLVLFVCGFSLLLLLNGCQDVNRKKGNVEVIIEGPGQFPQSLAGTWKAEGRTGWEVVFNPDGTISSAVLGITKIRMIPGRTKTVPMKGGREGIYKPGIWKVQYSPSSRELAVIIELDYVHLEMGPNLLEGRVTDTFIGQVSEDKKTWQADWFSFPDYTAYTPEPKKITIDPNSDRSFVGSLTFKKIEE